MLVPEPLEDGAGLHPLLPIAPDHGLERRRLVPLTRQGRWRQACLEPAVEFLGAHQRPGEEILGLSQLAVLTHGLAGDPEVAGDRPVGLAGAQPAHEFAYVECHQSPSCHGATLPGYKASKEGTPCAGRTTAPCHPVPPPVLRAPGPTRAPGSAPPWLPPRESGWQPIGRKQMAPYAAKSPGPLSAKSVATYSAIADTPRRLPPTCPTCPRPRGRGGEPGSRPPGRAAGDRGA